MHVGGKPCDPGMKGCVLAGRFRFTSEAKNPPESVRRRLSQAPRPSTAKPRDDDG